MQLFEQSHAVYEVTLQVHCSNEVQLFIAHSTSKRLKIAYEKSEDKTLTVSPEYKVFELSNSNAINYE